METSQIELRAFLRNLVNSMPKNRDKTVPFIAIEFYDPDVESGYSDPIYVYRIESLKIIKYKYAAFGGLNDLLEWTPSEGDYLVDELIPPRGGRSILSKRVELTLGKIRVRYSP